MTRFNQTEAMLLERAATKVSGTVDGLLIAAQDSLTNAGSWKDEVRIDVWLSKPYSGTRCARLLHGVPSPRFWATPAKNNVLRRAKDVIYFFGGASRAERLKASLPVYEYLGRTGAMVDELFVNSIRGSIDSCLIENASDLSTRAQHWSKELVHPDIAPLVSEIDRHAWFTKQRSMTLANAAPVWRPNSHKQHFAALE